MRFTFIALFSLSILSLTSCSKRTEIYGLWDMELNIQGETVPFQLEIDKGNKVTLINGAEEINLSYRSPTKDHIIIPVLGFDAQIELKKDKEKLSGKWTRENKTPKYNEPITGKRAEKRMASIKIGLPSKWKMTLFEKGKNKEAVLVFTETDEGVYASVLTTTGDYRYLSAKKDGNDLTLTGFDGVFAFVFKGKLDGGQYTGKMFAGKSWNQEFSATPSSSFELPSPFEATEFKGDLSKITLIDQMDGKKKNLLDTLGPKVKVIQIFGSWCPNCIDETRFIKSWRERNQDKDVAFAMIAFERSPNKAQALKMLSKAKALYRIDYPIFIGGHTSEDKVEEALPGLENFISFPTTLFVDKKGKVKKIHAGFSGPATGKYYEKFSMDFDKTIDKLLSEN